jgi:hypothetical protein
MNDPAWDSDTKPISSSSSVGHLPVLFVVAKKDKKSKFIFQLSLGEKKIP